MIRKSKRERERENVFLLETCFGGSRIKLERVSYEASAGDGGKNELVGAGEELV